jgi:O-antigen/teichoic acid export membrane protein
LGKDNLGKKTRNSLVWDLGGNLVRQFTAMVLSIVLARILAPEDFGIIGMALVFISLSQVFIDVGFTDGLIQQQDVSPIAWNSIFYINLLISLLLAGGIYLAAPAIGHFFNSYEVGQVIRYLVLVLPIAAAGKVHAAQLTKEMNFKALSLRDVISTMLGGIVGVIAAFQGQGVYSLVWQQLVTALTRTILLWISTRWQPQLMFSTQEVSKLLSFSSFVFFDQLFQQFFNKIDILFVGKVFSPAALGFYSRAESFKSLVNNYSTQSISKIAFPLFSAIQDDEKRFNDVFLKIISALIILTTTMVGILFFAADWFIVALLGEKWQASVPLFQILIFSSITLPFRTILFKAMLGKGLSRLKFSIGIFNNTVALASIPIGYFFGIEAFAWSIVGTRLFCTIINWIILKKRVFEKLENFLPTILLPFLSLTTWIVLYYSEMITLSFLLWVPLFTLSHLILLSLNNNIGLQVLKQEFKHLSSILSKKVFN